MNQYVPTTITGIDTFKIIFPYDANVYRPFRPNAPWPSPWPNPWVDPWSDQYEPFEPFIWPEEKKRARVRNPKKRRAQVRRRNTRNRAPVTRHTRRSTMAKKETHIVLVLDKSYSMENCRTAALNALNEQLDGIRANAHKGGKTYVSVVLFSNTIDIVHENVPATQLEHLTLSDYVLDGNTALRDAMMTAIDIIQPKTNRKKNQGFLVVLISDGQENASGTTKDTLRSRIEELEGTDCWTITYMLDGHSWEDIGDMVLAGYGASIGNYASFTSDMAGTAKAGLAAVQCSVNYLDARAQGVTSKRDFYTDAKLKLEGVGTADNK